MKKRILFFEPNETLSGALLEQLVLNKNFEVIQASNLDNIVYENKRSPFHLLIIGLDRGAFSLSSVKKFILEMQITNKILFIGNFNADKGASSVGSSDKYHFIEKPFKVQQFMKKIDFILAKISGSLDINHTIGPFVFFPEKKIITFNDQADIELTEKEVGILKCLLSSGEEIVDKDEILKQVWNYNPGVTTHTLETHIYRLRQKLEISPSTPRVIVSEGGGFKLNPV